MVKSLAALILILGLLPAYAYARVPLNLDQGESIRITVGGSRQVVTVAGVRNDTLLLRTERPDSPRLVSIAAIEALDALVPRTRWEGAMHGARWGFVIGLGGGVATGLISGSDPPCSGQELCFGFEAAGDKAFVFGVLGSICGAAVGALVGTAQPGITWKQVDMPVEIKIRPPRMEAGSGPVHAPRVTSSQEPRSGAHVYRRPG